MPLDFKNPIFISIFVQQAIIFSFKEFRERAFGLEGQKNRNQQTRSVTFPYFITISKDYQISKVVTTFITLAPPQLTMINGSGKI